MQKTWIRNLGFAATLLFSLSLTEGASIQWLTNVDSAKQAAAESNKLIMMSFQGSDWCANCKRLEKKLFSDPTFVEFANSELVSLKLDFPMKKENRLSEEQTKHNEELAEKFNPEGSFPKVLILDENLEVQSTFEYDPSKTVEQYITEIKNSRHD